MPTVLPAALQRLGDADDDVRSVAADALAPAAEAVCASAPDSDLEALLAQLWDILEDVDDLSQSTGR